MNGKIFTQMDLNPTPEIRPTEGAEVDEGLLDKINQFVVNVDDLLTHLVDIKEKYPDIMAKWGNLAGGRQLGQGKVYRGQFSPQDQPGGQAPNPGSTGKNIDPEKFYTFLMGLLHSFEGKGLTVEAVKQLVIANKAGVIGEVKKVLPSLLED